MENGRNGRKLILFIHFPRPDKAGRHGPLMGRPTLYAAFHISIWRPNFSAQCNYMRRGGNEVVVKGFGHDPSVLVGQPNASCRGRQLEPVRAYYSPTRAARPCKATRMMGLHTSSMRQADWLNRRMARGRQTRGIVADSDRMTRVRPASLQRLAAILKMTPGAAGVGGARLFGCRANIYSFGAC